MSREDYRTNTLDDAALYEQHRGLNDDYDDRPAPWEIADDNIGEPRHRKPASIVETVTAALRWSDDRPTVVQTRDGVVAITSTYTDERVATILRPLGIETGRGADGRLYARDNLTIPTDPWGPAEDPNPLPF